ncbi:MAG: metallophosphoesterase [Phycisphaerales bacterium]|nr:MAG: metallophosphoesterase [Phycisphaerales bacterium]
MLVLISDLHFTDGTSGEAVRAGAFKLFRERLRDLAYDASWRANGRYEPIERVDLVLLGDILDVIRSTKWLTGTVRPWSNWKSQAFKNKVRTITEAILDKNKESLGCLKSLQDPKVLTIPDATRTGRPKRVERDPEATGRLPVQVRVHYMVGNHDWFYHLPGASYNRLRQKIVDALGLSNSPNEPLAHEPGESPTIRDLLAEHRVFARHGDVFDPFNYEGDRNASSLGDAIVVELLNRFPSEVERQMGRQLPQECLDGLKEVDNVRPLMIIPGWIEGLLQRTCPDPGQAQRVKGLWDDLADEFLKLSFVRERDKRFKIDLVDKLQAALKFSQSVSLRILGRLPIWLDELVASKPSYEHALGEQAFKNRTARCVVYGHTHRHEVVPLDSCFMAQGLLNQRYVNSGTWRRVQERARWRPQEQEFMGCYVMTYVAVFRDNERGGRTLETWSGVLG